jgi:hypothetical protein
MDKTTQSLLQEMAQTGQAVIILTRARELAVAQALLMAGIVHVHSDRTAEGYIIIKFGRSAITI